MTSLIDGTVQQLAIHTAGGIVMPAQVLLIIAPSQGRLEIEAMVPNKEVGFVYPGQTAQIKVDTFTKYGLIHGTVESVSREAVVRDKPQDKPNEQALGSSNTTSEPAGQQLVFTTRVSMDRTEMMIDDREIHLSPGMVGIADGARSILSYRGRLRSNMGMTS